LDRARFVPPCESRKWRTRVLELVVVIVVITVIVVIVVVM